MKFCLRSRLWAAHATRVRARAAHPGKLFQRWSDPSELMSLRKVCFGESPKPACESRALLRVSARRRFLPPVIVPFALLMFVLFLVWLALPKPPLTEGIDFSTRVRDRNGDTLGVKLTSDQNYRSWTPLHDISHTLIDARLQFDVK